VAVELPVTFALSTCPGQQFRGRVVQLDRTTRESDAARNVVAARVWFDAGQLPDLRSGTTVRARIECGTRSLGYVWFRDLVDVVGTEVQFWF
jgi:hypothetical protein